MTEKVEVLQATGGDRLALVGLGADFPGSQHLESFLRAIIAGSLDAQQPAFVFVNNRLEGNAPTTIQAVVEED